MNDREQVISNLKKSIKYHGHLKDTFCKECIQSMNMAIAMLEEQEETINDLGDTIRQLNQHIEDISEYMTPYGKVEDIKACAELLKEQEAENSKISNAYLELVGKASKQPHIVRCKKCKHRPTDPENKGLGQYLEFPDDVCPCQIGDIWYSWMPEDNWFCADGEQKQQEENT